MALPEQEADHYLIGYFQLVNHCKPIVKCVPNREKNFPIHKSEKQQDEN